MPLGALLRSLHRLEQLPRLAAALGYAPEWRELPSGCLGTAGTTALVGRQGEFEWYGVEATAEGTAERAARWLGNRGMPAAVLALSAARRKLVVAALDAPPLELSLDTPDRLDLARLARCAAQPGQLALAALFRISEALAGRGVDQRFFAAFRRNLASLAAELPQRAPPADRHALALLVLTRILFLYFIEAKGWLDARPRFLREEVDRCLAGRRSLQRDLLHPLFFGTLNRPVAERSRLARGFGALPFLNGGLFEPHPLERRWKPVLPTPVLRDAFDSLFERFHFTLGAESGDAIAPDMLGRVFEGVMDPAERHDSGSYYTPAALVETLMREALVEWLAGQLREPVGTARARLEAPDPETRRRLATVRLLDPAAGSGAFLLGALRLLAGIAEGPGTLRAARLRSVLRHSLFGVDCNAAAVRLAELRLWLEVVAADPAERPGGVTPLPNLDALVRQGDSLIDPAAGLPLGPRAGARELSALREAVVLATGAAKRAASVALQRAERAQARAALRNALDGAEAVIAELLEAARGATLFGEQSGWTREQRARLGLLRRQRRQLRARLRELERSGSLPWFHYQAHFADVMTRGGFDLVVGNPPWVRAEALEPERRSYLAERYAWFRGSQRPTRGYAHQPDLAVVFLERALELTAPDGVVALLLPAKLTTAGYATAAREALARRTTVAVAADLRAAWGASFGATVYPLALIVRRATPPRGHRVRLELAAGDGGVPQAGLSGAAWILLPGPARRVLDRLRRECPPFAERFSCHLGVKTGLNRAFLDPPPEVEPELVRWAIRGRDVQPFHLQRVRRLLWPCDPAGRPLAELPPAAKRHLMAHAGALRRRADHTGLLWELFRTGPASAPYRVVWADLAARLAAAPLLEPGGSAAVPLNTCYVTPVPDGATALRLAAWLNSSWCRAIAAATADPASGGFARFNARVIAALPCPAAVSSDAGLLALGRAGVAAALAQEELDERCGDLLALGPAERQALAQLAQPRAAARR